MSKKLIILIAVVILSGMLLSSCRVRASLPPEPTQTPADSLFPVGEDQEQNLISEILTQTAAAGDDVPDQEPAEATPEPGAEGEEPAPGEGEENVGGGLPETEPQAPPQEPIAVPTLTRPSTYTLQRGEWPICIARRYDLPLSAFLSTNNLTMNSQLPAGSVLQIPQSGNWDPAHGSRSLKSHPTNYTVRAGDTVNSIACSFGAVSPEAIIAVNELDSPYTLTPGQTLQIP
ncbi:MAG: LysM peptidoglycan-binding domain-containing protein [Anaerolineaceae bacterium]|jgi:LysM repeat protein